jgi:hypothetical protein
MKSLLDYRYQGLSSNFTVLATGNRLGDVQRMGVEVIVDYKARRFAYQGVYPVARPAWAMRLPDREDIEKARAWRGKKVA